MFENLYFIMGISNSLLLILIFLVRKTGKIDTVKRIGYFYLILFIPASYALYLSISQQKGIQYIIFLVIFLIFLILEIIYDFILKLNFRKNWVLLTPYLAFYYAMNYGFFAMVWKESKIRGTVILILVIIQIAVNIWSHNVKKQRNDR